MLNHSRFPDGRAHGFAALANIGVLRAGRAQPLYLLTPPGRFGPSAQVSRLLNHSHFPDGRAHGFAAPQRVALPPSVATAHRAGAFLRATGHTLPSGAQSLMPQHFFKALRASEGRKKRGFPQKQGFSTVWEPVFQQAPMHWEKRLHHCPHKSLRPLQCPSNKARQRPPVQKSAAGVFPARSIEP